MCSNRRLMWDLPLGFPPFLSNWAVPDLPGPSPPSWKLASPFVLIVLMSNTHIKDSSLIFVKCQLRLYLYWKKRIYLGMNK